MQATYIKQATVNPTVLFQADNIQSFLVSLFTVSHGTGAGGSELVSLFLVPSGGVAAITNALVWQYSIAINAFFMVEEGWVVPPTYSLQIQTSVGSGVVMSVSGTLYGNP